MHNYDFHERFEWNTFQRFAVAILERKEKCTFHTSPPGRDGAIDFYNADDTIFGQVKNYKNDFKSLFQVLKQERERLDEIKPKRYILVTSFPYSKEHRKQILTLFDGYLKDEDLYGKEELNKLLDNEKEYGDIELSFLELCPSASIFYSKLDQTVHRHIYSNSSLEYDKMKKNMETFAYSDYLKDALKIIQKYHTIVISGEPGVGKTTLGHALSSYLLNKDETIQFIKITNIKELAEVYQKEDKQIFFFDDFWGASEYDNHITPADHLLLKDYIELIKNSPNKWLILTTREYIFRAGVSKSNKLISYFQKQKYILSLTKEDRLYKFQILSNHVKHANLSWGITATLLKNWERIVDHNNYTPRLIETFFHQDWEEAELLNTDQFVKSFFRYLENPEDYWQELFEAQTKSAQLILYMMMIYGIGIEQSLLRSWYFQILEQNNLLQDKDYANFESGMSDVEQAFIDRSEMNDEWVLQLRNPSFREYITQYFKQNIEQFLMLFISSTKNLSILLTLLKIINEMDKTPYLMEKEEMLTNLILHLKEEKNLEYYDFIVKSIDLNQNPIIKREIDYYYRKIKYLSEVDQFFSSDFYTFPYFYSSLCEDSPEYKKDLSYWILFYFESLEFYEYDNFEMFMHFSHIDSDVFKTFTQEHQDYLKEELREVVMSLAEYYVSDNDEIGFEILVYEELEELMKAFGFVYPPSWRAKFHRMSESSFHADDTDRTDYENWEKEYEKKELIKKEEKQKAGEEIQKIIGNSMELDEEEVIKWGIEKEVSLESRNKIKQMLQEEPKFYYSLLHCKSTLPLLIKAVEEDTLPENPMEWFQNIIDDYGKKSPKYLHMLYFLALYLLYNKKTMIGLNELLSAKEWEPMKEQIIPFLESSMIVKWGNWYQFLHPYFRMYLVLTNPYSYWDENAALRYGNMIYDLLERLEDWDRQGSYYQISKTEFFDLASFQKDLFEQGFVKLLFQNFLETIDPTDENTIAASMLNYFCFAITYRMYKDYHGYESEMEHSELMDLLQYYYHVSILDLFTNLSRIKSKYLKLLPFLEDDHIYVNDYLDDPAFLNTLKEMNITSKLVDIYKKVQKKYDKIKETEPVFE